MNVIFRRIENGDVLQTSNLFCKCIANLLAREELSDPLLQQQEIDRLIHLMLQSLKEQNHSFFVAEENGCVLGTIALLPPGDIIRENLQWSDEILEVSCVYVHPAFQQNGVGSFLFANILDRLKKSGAQQYYLDAGFTSSQRYWLNKLGPETHLLLDYWGDGQHHRIWEMEVDFHQ